MRMPGMGELVIILAIIVLVFGAKKLPQLGDGLGKALKSFKRGVGRDDVDELVRTKHPELRAQPNTSAPALSAELLEERS